MKKRALWKDIWREIWHSKSRFLSILALIMLGVAFFVGIKATGPDMIETADRYYKENKLADFSIQSTYGLDESDKALLEKTSGIKQIDMGYSADLLLNQDRLAMRIYSYDGKKSLNQYEALSGRVPNKSGEIALDATKKMNKKYQIGDTVTFVSGDGSKLKGTLKKDKFKVVGFVRSPMFIEKDSRGTSSVGNGSTDAFAVIPQQDFDSNVYTVANLQFHDMADKKAFSNGYKDAEESNKAKLEKRLNKQADKRLRKMQQDGYAKLDQAEKKLKAQEAKLAMSESIAQAGVAKSPELTEAKAKLEIKQQKLQQERAKIEALEKPEYFVLDRSNNPGYAEYKENADRLTSLSTIFPVFFFLIAALVCLTTMTRMVEEQRTQIGTFKALGYSSSDIMKKFLVYGSLASLIGTGIGLVVGFLFFPTIIFNAYGMMYDMPAVALIFYPSYSVMALLVALLCTTVTAFAACLAELRSNAATLMRPKAPKQGKRILLERVGFIWKHMNFSSKVTARNIFRYKQRMLMTIVGVAGCTALILTGFGLRDSISDIATLQYGSVLKYDAIVTRDKTATEKKKAAYNQLLSDDAVTGRMPTSMKTMDTVKAGTGSQAVQLTTFATTEKLDDFIHLENRESKENLKLDNRGAVVTEKLAKLLDLKKGSTLVLKDTDHKEYRFKVTGIAENYAGHYVYLTKNSYEKAFHEAPSYDTDLLNLKHTSKAWENQFAEKLMDQGGVLGVTFSNTISDMLTDMLKSLNIVMVVLIVSAAILAFIVLYNLTNINVSERIRELSTIKVLGFYPKEVTMYVYRENIILTVLGILVGFIFGFFLHRFVIQTAEVDNMMFSPTITWPSYVYSAILTLLFSTIVMLVMHYKLKKIDMIEALKSVE
ncbi:FtsX-like permease family protein [Listeria aquatica]|uniref:FtsX-like permease family protein n=1 Tax=Listeria aquatica TaxID=1494960 RepID=UPI003F702557